MKNESARSLLVVTGAIIFNIIFWQEKLAVNIIFFDLFVTGSVFYLYPGMFKKAAIRWLVPAHLITVIAVIVHNTVLSKLAFTTTLLLLVAFSQYLHRSAWYAAGSVFLNYVMFPVSLGQDIAGARRHRFSFSKIRKALRLLIIPLILAGIFLILYSFANTVFNDVINAVASFFQKWLSHLFEWFSWSRFVFLLVGLCITGGLLLKSRVNYFSETDTAKKDALNRKKHDLKKWRSSGMFDLLRLFMGRYANGVFALRNENTTGIISLVMLNLLLLSINALDIVYVWFGFTYSPNINLSQYLHEGAGLLIFSIVLAMMVLLFFFRGNLNFYKQNKWLRYGAYAWILQNMILVVSVAVRAYYYFVHYGMAYKRIGVLVFLLLVLFGLLTVFIKIRFTKTNYFLFRVNAWFVVAVLVISSCIHWDEWIAGHNLARKGKIPLDVEFLLSLSDKTLPLIEKNADVLEDDFLKQYNGDVNYLYRGGTTPKQYFEYRKRIFFEEQQQYSWLSWNAADAYVLHHLSKPVMASLK